MAILSISREYNSGGEEIGRAVAGELHYEYVNKARLSQLIQRAGKKWGNISRELDEIPPSFWERFDWEYRGYVTLVEANILEYALRNRLVVLGRGSHILLKSVPYALKVRVIAPLEKRIERTMDLDRLDRRAALAKIEKTDRDRASYLKANYGQKWNDTRLYDLVLNTGLQTYEQIAQLLVKALQEADLRTTPEAEQRLRNQAVTARIKAELFTDSQIFIPTLEVFHDGSAVVLRGVVHSAKEFQYLEETALKFASGQPVRNELHYRG
jgi:cytidylate kinase